MAGVCAHLAFMCSGDLNSGPHPYVVSALSMEPHLQPLALFPILGIVTEHSERRPSSCRVGVLMRTTQQSGNVIKNIP